MLKGASSSACETTAPSSAAGRWVQRPLTCLYKFASLWRSSAARETLLYLRHDPVAAFPEKFGFHTCFSILDSNKQEQLTKSYRYRTLLSSKL